VPFSIAARSFWYFIQFPIDIELDIIHLLDCIPEKGEINMTRALQKHVARRQDQTFADWFAELRELAGERWADVADQAPTVYAVWGGGATPAQALYMVGLILPPKTAAA
jgi:hypothetical protein